MILSACVIVLVWINCGVAFRHFVFNFVVVNNNAVHTKFGCFIYSDQIP